MKRQGAGRVLTFAVTGALLGGVGIGGCNKHRGPLTNPGPADYGPPEPEEQLHVNPGPDEDAGAADGAADGGGRDEPLPDVNPGPIDQPTPEPKPPVIVNTVKQPEPEPPIDPGTSTMNIRKVEDEPPPAPKRPKKIVNTVKVPEPAPPPTTKE